MDDHGQQCGVYEIGKRPYAMSSYDVVEIDSGRQWHLNAPLSVFDVARDGEILIRDGDRLRIARNRDLTGGAYLRFEGDRCLSATFLSETGSSASSPRRILACDSDGSVWLVRRGHGATRVRHRRLTLPTAVSSGASGKVLVYFAPKTKIRRTPVASSVELYDARKNVWRTLWRGVSLEDASMDDKGLHAAVLTSDGKVSLKIVK